VRENVRKTERRVTDFPHEELGDGQIYLCGLKFEFVMMKYSERGTETVLRTVLVM
jgi:hypothetical protein